MSDELRGYQKKLKSETYEAWTNGHRNVLQVLPTGGGKTKIFSDIVKDHYRAGQRSALIAHRNELVVQMSCALAEAEVPHRIIGSPQTIAQTTRKHRKLFGKSMIYPTAGTGVIGVDTLISRREGLRKWAEQIDLWVNDEGHHLVKGNKWGTAVEMFTNARGLAVTATPLRADGQGLGRHADGYMDFMVQGPTTRWLMDNGFLADYEIACPLSDFRIDEDRKGKDGDFTNESMRKATRQSHIIGDVVENYAKFAFGRQAIVFATDVETAVEMERKFNEFGIRAVTLTGTSLGTYREQSLDLFAERRIQVLINVDLFDEGFNCPNADVCIMARPTASLAKYLQMIGRVLRPAPGKVALVIDHVSNILRHKYPDFPRVWSMDRRDKKAKQKLDPEEIPQTRCTNPMCNKPYEKFRVACPHCGHEKPLPDPRTRSIEMIEGDLILLDKEQLDRMRAATILETPAEVGARVAAAAGAYAGAGVANKQAEKISAQKKLIDSIAAWAGIMRHREYSDREIHKIFYALSGMDVLSALDRSRSRKDYEQIADLVQSWVPKE
jgi:superfamily II DNA or RNA helicase